MFNDTGKIKIYKALLRGSQHYYNVTLFSSMSKGITLVFSRESFLCCLIISSN